MICLFKKYSFQRIFTRIHQFQVLLSELLSSMSAENKILRFKGIWRLGRLNNKSGAKPVLIDNN